MAGGHRTDRRLAAGTGRRLPRTGGRSGGAARGARPPAGAPAGGYGVWITAPEDEGAETGSSGRSELRILFAFDPARQAILLVAGDKSGNWKSWYRKNIPLADDLLDDHLRMLKGE